MLKEVYRVCPKCGMSNDANANFCLKCGTKLTDADKKPLLTQRPVYRRIGGIRHQR